MPETKAAGSSFKRLMVPKVLRSIEGACAPSYCFRDLFLTKSKRYKGQGPYPFRKSPCQQLFHRHGSCQCGKTSHCLSKMQINPILNFFADQFRRIQIRVRTPADFTSEIALILLLIEYL